MPWMLKSPISKCTRKGLDSADRTAHSQTMAGTYIAQGLELPQEVLTVTDYPHRPSGDLPIKIFLRP